MNQISKAKVKRWRNLVKDGTCFDSNKCKGKYFIKFALEYFAFNEILKNKYNEHLDRGRINKFKNEFRDNDKWEKQVLKRAQNTINDLKKELDKKPLQNLTRNNHNIIEIKDSNDFDGIIEAVYIIRNNLFHGEKDPDEKRDKHLVGIGSKLLSVFNDYLLEIDSYSMRQQASKKAEALPAKREKQI